MHKKSIISKNALKHFWGVFASVATALLLFAKIFQEHLPNTPGTTIVIVTISLCIAIFCSFPPRKTQVLFANPNTKISVCVGDLFAHKDYHLAIGFSDTFDTEIGKIISNETVQGKFLSEVYKNNRERLEHQLESALHDKESKTDENKIDGKNKRYAIGTIAVLNSENRKFFCCAYSKMGNDLKAKSDIENIWKTLNCLWDSVRKKGEQKPLAMPVFGAGMARVSGVSLSILIKLITVSFIVNSRHELITKELKIVIHKKDVEKVNLFEIKDFVKSLNN